LRISGQFTRVRSEQAVMVMASRLIIASRFMLDGIHTHAWCR
jgi:hypothetical protein